MADPIASPGQPLPTRPIEGAAAGALAGGVALLVLLVGSAASGTNGFLEAAHDGLTRYIPLPLFDAAIGALGTYAKGLLAIAVAVGLLAVGAVLGVLLVRTRTVGVRSGLADALLVALLAWLLAEAIALPLFGAGFFGSSLDVDPVAFHGPLVLAALVYGLVLVGIVRDGRPTWAAASGPAVLEPAASDPAVSGSAAPSEPSGARQPAFGRRTFLGRALVLVGLGSIGVSGVALASRVVAAGSAGAAVRPVVPGDAFGPTPAVTPLDQFYVVGKDLGTPQVDAASWRLTIGGLVDRPASYTLDQLRGLPSVEGYRTLQCISNEVVTYGRYIGNQRWMGIRASDVIDAAGVAPSARFVLWRSADGYTESIPLDVARDERTWLVYEMGPPGTPLPPEHGFPLRVLIAGRYGMKQPKFLTDIVLADHDEPGFWEQRGWDETAGVRTYSRIDLPRDGDEVPAGSAFPVFGVASSGDRGIARVEVSADGGSTWQDATLEPDGGPIGDLTWVRWRAEVRVATPGRVGLLARATDGRGNVQDATPRGALPSGATGLMRVTVTAIAG